jgi:hypothetical protein
MQQDMAIANHFIVHLSPCLLKAGSPARENGLPLHQEQPQPSERLIPSPMLAITSDIAASRYHELRPVDFGQVWGTNPANIPR